MPSAFKKVDSIWCEVLFIVDDEDEPVAIWRIFIKTKRMDKVNGCINMDVDGIKFQVNIIEVANWLPPISHVNQNEGDESDIIEVANWLPPISHVNQKEGDESDVTSYSDNSSEVDTEDREFKKPSISLKLTKLILNLA
ncbi:unnamed protein product [Lactuca saligna]|uniref:Uncharacterized protein n=1 Tax=Lactuca saligna TaxID=75948 RepID=A0AA36E3E7_LACSI|nr:unnamed protein product [Lactuca saligna]